MNENMNENIKEEYFAPERSELIEFLYETSFGAMLLDILTKKPVSRCAGYFLDTRASLCLVEPFVKKFGIDRAEAEDREYESFNDFFTRKLVSGSRPVDMEKGHLVSPCDSYLSVYKIDDTSRFTIKNSEYSVRSLTKSGIAAEKYKGGYCAVFRLTVSDYHRYIYIDDCTKTENRFIPGILHTVNPAAVSKKRVYTENSREVTLLHTDNFGDVAQIEVGALLVGRIENHHGAGRFQRGEEKGLFLYGGSTIVLLFEKGKVRFDGEVLGKTLEGLEKKVRVGEKIGEKPEKYE